MPDGRRLDRQVKLRERFLDLASAYVRMRMNFLRAIGIQPPEESPRRRNQSKRTP
jgi:hypothetical protein